MPNRTICISLRDPGLGAVDGLEGAARYLLDAVPAVRCVQVGRVLRHLSTDYLANDRPYRGVCADADRVDAAIDLCCDDEAARLAAVGSTAFGAFLSRASEAGELLFMLDGEPNVAWPLSPSAGEGGFRRWLLLTRKPATAEAFRDAWFHRHAALVARLPLLQGYVQNLITARYDGAGRPVSYDSLPIDGLAEVCYSDEEAMNLSYASQARLPLRDDGALLSARVSTLLMQVRALHREAGA